MAKKGSIDYVPTGKTRQTPAGEVPEMKPKTPRDALLSFLWAALQGPTTTAGQKAELQPIFDELLNTFQDLKIIEKTAKYYTLEVAAYEGGDPERVRQILESSPVYYYLDVLMRDVPPTPKRRGRPARGRVGVFKKPVALVEQSVLKHRAGGLMPTLFDQIAGELEQPPGQAVLGIDATAEEMRFLNALSYLLAEKSQIKDKTRPDYYAGNEPPEPHTLPIVAEGSNEKFMPDVAPVLALSRYEIAKAYRGDTKPTGEDYAVIDRLLAAAQDKRFFMRYSVEFQNEGKRYTAHVNTNQPIVLSQTSIQIVEQDTGATFDGIRIVLHPIMRHGIGDRFVLVPKKLPDRLQGAWGAGRMPAGVYKVFDFLLLEKWRGKPIERNMAAMYEIANLDGLVRRRKATEARAQLERILNTLRGIGLLKSWKVEPAKSGGEKVVMIPAKDWPQTNGG